MFDAKHICIIRLGGLGDVINTLPAFEAVRAAWPAARIAWLVDAAWQGVLPRPPKLDEVIALPRKDWRSKLTDLDTLPSVPGAVGQFVRDLRARNFDLAIDFHGNLRSGIASLLTGAPTRVGFAPGFCKEFSYMFATRVYPVGGGRVHRIDRALALAKAMGAPPVVDTPKVELAADALAFARDAFDRAHLASRPVVAVSPGTSRFGAYKRWPADRYAEVIRQLDADGFAAVVVWGPDEKALATAVAAGTSAVISPPTGSVAQLAALLSLCDAFIGSDSGPAMLAAAVGTPPVVLFGPKDPALYAPRHPRTRVVEVPLECRPCDKRTCDDPRCMLHITVGHVVDAALALLNEMEGN